VCKRTKRTNPIKPTYTHTNQLKNVQTAANRRKSK
jgi:hypothetical protein